MTGGRKIQRILVTLTWCLLGVGMLVLLGAAVQSKSEALCRGVQIDINSSDKATWFVDKKDVMKILANHGEPKFSGARMHSFNLPSMERRLEKSTWIRDAQLFFDNNGMLQVHITEREPVARIFTTNGSSFYLDTAMKKLPLSDKTVAKLPVFTGFPVTGVNIAKKDSALARDVIRLSDFISRDPFWQAQVAQVNINGNNFELIPLIGDQVIELGTADELEKKFSKLFKFYRQVVPRAGLNKYAVLRLQFDGQVVAVKKAGFVSRADSLKVISNIESMIAGVHDNAVKMIDSVEQQKDKQAFVTNNTTKN